MKVLSFGPQLQVKSEPASPTVKSEPASPIGLDGYEGAVEAEADSPQFPDDWDTFLMAEEGGEAVGSWNFDIALSLYTCLYLLLLADIIYIVI